MPANTESTEQSALTWAWDRGEKAFVKVLLEGDAIMFPAKAPGFIFLKARNPTEPGLTDRSWMIVEPETGYVLAYGATESGAVDAARLRFHGDYDNLNQISLAEHIRYHVKLLGRMTGIPEKQLPTPRKIGMLGNMVPV